MAEIICGGFGGQGILTTGMILANIGVDEGLEVSWSPSYGSEMRGGTANCSVILSDDEVGSPKVTYPDYLVVMNLPALQKFEHSVRDNGAILIDSSIVPTDRAFPEALPVYAVEATQLAHEAGAPRGANVIMLGALIKISGLFSEDAARRGMNRFFERKGKNSPGNDDCFTLGYTRVYRVQ